LVADKCQQDYTPNMTQQLSLQGRSQPPMPPQRKSKPRSPYLAALGQAIELIIAENAHMTHETVATDSGLTVKQVGDLVRGQGNPTYTTVLKLCQGLHVRPGELMARVDHLLDERLGS
jgi:transcriptional regulator with XRE-family HTH domain